MSDPGGMARPSLTVCTGSAHLFKRQTGCFIAGGAPFLESKWGPIRCRRATNWLPLLRVKMSPHSRLPAPEMGTSLYQARRGLGH